MARIQLNFTDPLEISQNEDQDTVELSFLSEKFKEFLSNSSYKLYKKCPR